jgi:hypothetical protein
LFLAGITSTQASGDDDHAANVASFLIAQRVTDPTNTNSATAASPIPALTVTASNTNYVTASGAPTNAQYATYQMAYTVQTSNYKVSRLALTLSAPAQATLANARSRYDVVTYVNLP